MVIKNIRGALAASAALAAIALPVGLYAAQSDNATTIARVNLRALNNSGAQGQATLRLSADQRTLTVSIKASGLEAGGAHISHIHGLSEGGTAVESTCPGQSEDADRDGFVELEEGGVKYGPILVDFMNVDPDMDGNVDFQRTIQLTGAEQALPLQLRHIVVHGMTVPAGPGASTPGEVNGENGYLTVLPVLCGEVEQVGGGRGNRR
jgi:hypothetical protein